MTRAEREEIVAYVLGRMSVSEVEAFEERVAGSRELSRLVDAARAELVKCASTPVRNQTLETALMLRLQLVEAESHRPAPPQTRAAANDHSTTDTSAEKSAFELSTSERAPMTNARKRPKRKLEFIPKHVETPERRGDSQFVFKRATVMSAEERDRRRAAARRAQRPARSFFARGNASYSLVDSAPNCADTLRVATRLRAEYAASLDANLRERLCQDGAWREPTAALVDRSAFSLAAKTPSVGAAFAQRASESSAFEYAPGVFDATARTIADLASVNYAAPHLAIVGASSVGAYELAPVEYAQGQTRVAELATPYRFEELERAEPEVEPVAPTVPTSALEPSSAVPPVVPRFATASQETIDAISTAIGQSAHILPQDTNAYYSAELDQEDREALGATLSAEDKRLAELLGRELTAIDLDEYYWEEVDDSDAESSASARRPSFGIFTKLFYLITAPPVLVGRATLAVFRTIFPHDLEREEASRETRRRGNDKEQVGRFSDMMISTVAGVLIAVCVVYPLLYRVFEELYLTVASSVVRRYSQNVALPQLEGELDAVPFFITEQILHPRFDASGVGGGAADGGIELENDGLPISP